MADTPHLGLPLVAAAQAQKHVTVNEALRRLDALVQLAVLDRTRTTPPESPGEGDRHIVAAPATGAWAGRANQVAAFLDGAWEFFAPTPGFLAFVVSETALLHWTGSVWSDASVLPSALQNLALLGVGTTADAANPFAAKLNKALWTARTTTDGGDGDLRYTLNKEGTGNVLSLLLQSNWSGRAELGLVGDDDFSLKVSADGSAWTSALAVDRSSGRLALSSGQLRFPAAQNPSSDPNTLDDYEEGTFTPALTAASPPTGVAYGLQSGAYVKLGRLVHVEGRVTLSSKGSGGSGTAELAGLPFAAAGLVFVTALRPSGITLAAGNLLAANLQGTSLVLQSLSNTGAAALAWSAVGSTADLVFSADYLANA